MLDRAQGAVWVVRQEDIDPVAGADITARHDNRHDASLADKVALRIAVQRRRH